MAIDAVSTRAVRARPTALARLRAVPAWVVLGTMVISSAALRIATGLAHVTPRYFPDEYIYFSLARSLASGRLEIRGHAAHFPALLEPLLAAPFWLVADVGTAYRLTQGLHAVAMSLAAVPVYLLARRLGLGSWEALACAAFTLVLPALVFSSYVTADAVGFTLALATIYVGTVALERPTRRAQVVFLAFAFLTTFARVQYVVLPIAFAVAAFVVSRGRPLTVARRYPLLTGVFSIAVLGALVAGPGRALGYYHGVLSLQVSADSVARWIGIDAMMLVYAAGVVMIPAALVGTALALVRPASVAEQAFAGFTTGFTAFLLLEAGVYAASGTARFQGRYLEAIAPLVPLLFCLGMRRMGERRAVGAVAAISTGLLLLAAWVPLSGYASGDGKQDSPLLQAVFQLEQLAGVGDGSLVVALAAGILALVAAAAALRPRGGTYVALVVAIVAVGSAAVAGTSYDISRARLSRSTFLPSDPRWVDHAGLGNVSVLVTPYSLRAAVSEQLFWNARLTRLLQMRGAEEVDAFGAEKTAIGRDGAVLADGKPVTGPLLVEQYADDAQLADARLVAQTGDTTLWQPQSTLRFAALTEGRYFDGWFTQSAQTTVWPTESGPRVGILCFHFAPPVGADTTLDLRAPGYTRTVRVTSAHPVAVAVPVVARAPWTLTVTARKLFATRDGRVVSTSGAAPRLFMGKASPSTCR
jgi:hypothetical protein